MLLVAAAISITLSLAFMMPANAMPETILSTEPSSRTVALGDLFQVHVMITDVFDLYGYQFTLNFDPTVLQVTDLMPHEGSTDEFGFFHNLYMIWDRAVDNEKGYVTIAITPPLGTKRGGFGSGMLATIEFQAMETGRTKLTFESTKLTRPSADSVPHVAVGGVITVGEVTDLPVSDAGGPYAGVKDEPMTFNAWASNDPNGYLVSWSWDFGDGITGAGMIVDHAYSDVGVYKVVLTVTDNQGYTDTSETTVEVVAPTPSSAAPKNEDTSPVLPPATVDAETALAEANAQRLRTSTIGTSSVFIIVLGLVLLKRPVSLRVRRIG
jgi:hypothetical protein